MKVDANNHFCLLSSSHTSISQKGWYRKREVAFCQEVVCYRYKSHLMASVKSKAKSLAGGPQAFRGLFGRWFTLSHDNRNESYGSTVHQQHSFLKVITIYTSHCYPKSNTCLTNLDIESSTSMFLTKAKQNLTCYHKFVIPSGDMNNASWSLI